MFKKILEKFKGDRKYFSIVFFVLIAVAISGIITNSVLDNQKNNWDKILSEKIASIQNQISSDFKSKENDLLGKLKSAKTFLSTRVSQANEPYRQFIEILNLSDFDNYSVELFAPNGKLIAWSKTVAINQKDLFPLSFPLGEAYFLNTPLDIHFSIIDTVHIQADIFYLAISTSIQKKYTLQNDYFTHINFSDYLSALYNIECEIDFDPYAVKTKDGKKYSFDILNSVDNKIGQVTISKPTLVSSLNEIKENSSVIQSLFIFFALVFIALGLKSDYKNLKSYTVKLILLIIYLTLARVILFYIGIPSKIITGSLSDPANFSSTFGFGIVKSPIEFLTTNLFVVIIGLQFFRYSYRYTLSENKSVSKFFIVLVVISSLLFFYVIRGFSASLRSVIFDSALRYFREPNIIPDLNIFVMILNILLLGFSIIALLLSLINVASKLLKLKNEGTKSISVLWIYLLFTATTIFLFYLNRDPLISIYLLLVFLILIFLLHYQTLFRTRYSIFNYILILLVAAITSISLLNFFNVKLERESLKTTAFEINRADKNLLRFILRDVINDALTEEENLNLLNRKDYNYDAFTFSIWSKSTMQKESMNSFLALYDRFGKKIGSFSVGMEPNDKLISHSLNYLEGIQFVDFKSADNNENEIGLYAIQKIFERNITKGFIAAGISFNIQTIGAKNYSDFLESSLPILNKVVDIKQLKIFQFKNSNLTQFYGDVYPSRDQIKQIINKKLSPEFNESWLKMDFGGEKYETYILKSEYDSGDVITAVAVADKEFSWNLFNFFKVFIVHTIIILIVYLLLFTTRVRKIKLTFKTKLLITFLVISVVPVIILALYNRGLVEERVQESILNELKQRADYIENHINSQIEKNKDRDLIKASENASKELKISFSIYQGTDELFSSNQQYSNIGLFDKKLNSEAYYHLNYLRFREYITKERINEYRFNTYYKFIDVHNSEYILSVNDAFNKIKVSFSTIEIDVVIFGIYSFAVLIIIIVSTIFANQISMPIQRMTKATEAISKGDLNIRIVHNEKGEIKDLLDGFNMMTSELKRNQMEIAEMEREAAWKEMAKQVAHEIKNPLTPMKLALQQLVTAYKDKSKDFENLFDRLSSTILNQIDNLSQIASEFSRFAKMPSLKLEKLDLVSILNDTINLFIDEKAEISLQTDLASAFVEADQGQLRRMIINLIRNSIQAEANLIGIELLEVESNYSLKISDNGHGIDDKIKDKIFNENFTTKIQGMGIGLSLTKRFIESINGNIQLHSSSSNGSIFIVTIPKSLA